jgi:hypothetical protein
MFQHFAIVFHHVSKGFLGFETCNKFTKIKFTLVSICSKANIDYDYILHQLPTHFLDNKNKMFGFSQAHMRTFSTFFSCFLYVSFANFHVMLCMSCLHRKNFLSEVANSFNKMLHIFTMLCH